MYVGYTLDTSYLLSAKRRNDPILHSTDLKKATTTMATTYEDVLPPAALQVLPNILVRTYWLLI